MEYAEQKLRQYIGDGSGFADPLTPLALNYTGRFAESGQQIAQSAPLQVTHPVMWYPGMERAIEYSESLRRNLNLVPEIILLEVGSNTILTGIDKHFKDSHERLRLVSFQDALLTGLDPEAQTA